MGPGTHTKLNLMGPSSKLMGPSPKSVGVRFGIISLLSWNIHVCNQPVVNSQRPSFTGHRLRKQLCGCWYMMQLMFWNVCPVGRRVEDYRCAPGIINGCRHRVAGVNGTLCIPSIPYSHAHKPSAYKYEFGYFWGGRTLKRRLTAPPVSRQSTDLQKFANVHKNI